MQAIGLQNIVSYHVENLCDNSIFYHLVLEYFQFLQVILFFLRLQTNLLELWGQKLSHSQSSNSYADTLSVS